LDNELMQQVQARRDAWSRSKPVGDEAGLWGLALSGGGIRSATFCFGLLRALALEKLLLRFDLMSTVSGGGYIGGMVGRLFSRAANSREALRIQAALGEARSNWFLWWLRANGRYLIPRGARDATFVGALYIRNLVAIHFELGIIALMLGVLLAAGNLLAWWGAHRLGFAWPTPMFAVLHSLPDWIPLWFPMVWLVLPGVVLLGATRAVAYWIVPWLKLAGRWALLAWLAVLAATAWLVTVYLRVSSTDGPVGEVMRTALWSLTAALMVLWLLGVPLGMLALRRAGPDATPHADAARSHLTATLARSFRWFSLIALAGLVDRAAWFLAFELEPLTETGQGAAALWLAVWAGAIRTVLPLASQLLPGRSSTAALLFIGRMLGYALTFCLCVWWVSLVHKAVMGAVFTHHGASFSSGVQMLVLFALPLLGFFVVTSRNVEFLNLSSLHAFYQARLVRGYLGAANGKRLGAGSDPLSALNDVPVVMPMRRKSVPVDDLNADDDIALADYRPQDCGAPVHLLNVCINQTQDPRGGLFNQDRRGLPLTVASGGLAKVSQEAWGRPTAQGTPSLGGWMAISGAAIAPGLGNLTRGGISALATFAGIRLGFWWDQSARTGTRRPWHRLFTKSCGVLSETFGSFKGGATDNWFLTDGGHFENTGAYALLAERAEVIVLADCGADPRYEFENLENLVRKARIDLKAEILFQRPKPAMAQAARTAARIAGKYRVAAPPGPGQAPPGLARFGSLNDLASPNSTACLALAKVRYGGATPTHGILIVIKPNLCEGLPVDLVNFKRQNPAFPQETTADQFFSEAQWESYFHLGTFLGQNLDRKWINTLLRNPGAYFEDDDCSPFEAANAQARDERAAAAVAAPQGRLPTRISNAATAVGATLSLGAAATLGVAAWQGIETTRSAFARQKADERAAMKELTELWAKATPGGGAKPDAQATANLAAALLRTADTLCPSDEARWFTRSDLARRIHLSAMQQCGAITTTPPEPCAALLAANEPQGGQRNRSCLLPAPEILAVVPPPRYWVYDYTGTGAVTSSHPCDPVVAERHAQQQAATGALREGPPAACRYSGRFSLGTLTPGPTTAAPAQPAPTAPTAPATPAAPASAPPSQECAGTTVFLQIYGPSQRRAVWPFRRIWRAMGAEVPPTEDVVETANARGYASPPPVQRTTVRFHDIDSLLCARALGPQVGFTNWKVEPLSARYKPRANTVEVWVAPSDSTLQDHPLPPVENRPPPIPRSQVPG
jgi:hypothetical protein